MHIIRRARSNLLDDIAMNREYLMVTRQNNTHPTSSQLASWMTVPMNALTHWIRLGAGAIASRMNNAATSSIARARPGNHSPERNAGLAWDGPAIMVVGAIIILGSGYAIAAPDSYARRRVVGK